MVVGINICMNDVNRYIKIKKYKLLDWVNVDNLNSFELSSNPKAIEILKNNPDKIDWEALSSNINAIELLKNKVVDLYLLYFNPNAIELFNINSRVDSTYIFNISQNPNAIEFLKTQHPDIIKWDWLSMNPAAIELLKANPNKINWSFLSKNPNPLAIDLLKANPGKINWQYLATNTNPEVKTMLDDYNSKQPALHVFEDDTKHIDWDSVAITRSVEAMELLKANPDKINWLYLSVNPYAIELLNNNQAMIDWDMLSYNEAAIELLKNNQDKINWFNITCNDGIYTLI